MNRKVVYAIWLEDLFSPILKTQVFDVLGKISRTGKYKIFVIAFQSIYTIYLKHRKLRKLRKELKKNEIRLVVIPCLTTLNVSWFFARWWIVPIIFLQTFPFLFLLTFISGETLLHCRSYQTTLSAIAVKKLRNLKVIFDPRSPFPEEVKAVNRLAPAAFTYRLWKKLERLYLLNSDVTVGVSDAFIKYFKQFGSNSNFAVIPNNVDATKFVRDDDFRMKFREEMGISDDEIVFVYCGSLSSRWNNPLVYANFIVALRSFDMKHRFLFVSPNIRKLEIAFNKKGIKRSEYFAIAAAMDDVPKYLSAADFGLNLMGEKDIRMSVKTAEYLSASLPVIVNSNVLGAREIIKRYGVGLVLAPGSVNNEALRTFIQQSSQLSPKCRNLALKMFSTEKVAEQYLEVYSRLCHKFGGSVWV